MALMATMSNAFMPQTMAVVEVGRALQASSSVVVSDSFALSSRRRTSSTGSLGMAPRYDPSSGLWEATKPEEDSEAGYPLVGSLIRQGPLPFFQRLKDPFQYDQAVLKMMASEGMDRNEAQGNMDAYLQNPNDWALQKMEEKNGAPKFDYANANIDDNSLILTGSWTGILLAFVSRIVYVTLTGCDAICQEYHF